MLGLGFGFVEIGTLTPLPQDGNPPPRLFRLRADRASSTGSASTTKATRRRSTGSTVRAGRAGIVGVNIGANRDSEDRLFDYYAGVRLFAPIASYLTVNVSSPNTPGLRDLQSGEALTALLRRDRRSARRGGGGMRAAHAAPPQDRAGPRRPRRSPR